MDRGLAISIAALVLLICIPVYLIWPFSLEVEVRTASGQPVMSNITIYHSIGPMADSAEGTSARFSLWKGEYVIEAVSPGFAPASYEVSNPLAWRMNRDMNLTVVMKPISVSLAQFDFRDPTGYLKLYPWLEFNGTSIGGERVSFNLTQNSMVESGWYTVRAADPHFNATFQFLADAFPEKRLQLEPNSLYDTFSEREAEHAVNFLKDHIKLTRSPPTHFYLATQQRHLSLGDMISLGCQQKAAELGHSRPEKYILPKSRVYREGFGGDCYTNSLDGVIPSEAVKNLGLPEQRGLAMLLNQAKGRYSLSLTMNLESGLYRNTHGAHSLGPCHNATTKLGIAPDDLACNDPSIIPWFSPLVGPHNGDLPYPWATGREGIEDILSLPERYGIPITLFVTPRDLLVLTTYDPDLTGRIARLVQEGSVEIGAMSWYYSQPGARKIDDERDDLRKTKALLEREFSTNVSGVRMPYYGLLRGNPRTHDDIIRSNGYLYYSGLQYQSSAHNIPSTHKLTSPFQSINGTTVASTVLTGRPWDFTHREVVMTGEIFLKRDPSLHQESMAKILKLISEGATVRTLQEIAHERERSGG